MAQNLPSSAYSLLINCSVSASLFRISTTKSGVETLSTHFRDKGAVATLHEVIYKQSVWSG